MMSTRLCVPLGTPVQARGGLALAPSPVNSTGRASPSFTAGLVSLSVEFLSAGLAAATLSTAPAGGPPLSPLPLPPFLPSAGAAKVRAASRHVRMDKERMSIVILCQGQP